MSEKKLSFSERRERVEDAAHRLSVIAAMLAEEASAMRAAEQRFSERAPRKRPADKAR